jgi:hypothetical protein
MDKAVAMRAPAGVKPHQTPPAMASITRRQLLAGIDKAAVLAMLPLGCAPAASTPFADGTFWDDGSGWSA